MCHACGPIAGLGAASRMASLPEARPVLKEALYKIHLGIEELVCCKHALRTLDALFNHPINSRKIVLFTNYYLLLFSHSVVSDCL